MSSRTTANSAVPVWLVAAVSIAAAVILRLGWILFSHLLPDLAPAYSPILLAGVLLAVGFAATYMLLYAVNLLVPGLFGIIHRTLYLELLRVFLLCLFALAGIFTLLAVLQQIQFGVSLTQALRMLPLLIPTSVPWITPPAGLFASCVVYGRMANDNEAVALKAAGVDLLSVLRPAMALGLVAAAFTGYLQYGVTPQAWRGSREVLVEDPEEAIGLFLKRKQTLEFKSGDGVVRLRVKDVQDVPADPADDTADGKKARPKQRLLDVVVKQRKGNAAWDEPEVVARTREAVLRVDTAAGEMELVAERWEMLTSGGQGTTHPDKPSKMKLPGQFDLDVMRQMNRTNPAMVDWPDLAVVSARARADADESRRLADGLAALGDRLPTAAEAADLRLSPVAAADRGLLAKAAADNLEAAKGSDRLHLNMGYEYHLRPAIAFGCLLFAVLGCPVGLWANRADYLSIFVICFLPALVVYYPVLFMVGGYARDGKLPMAAGVWAANGVLAAAAAVLSWRLIRR